MVWMYLVSLFGFSFAILSMAEMSSMYVDIYVARFCITVTDNSQGSYIRRTVSVSDIAHNVMRVCVRSCLGMISSMVYASMFEQNFTDIFTVCPIMSYLSRTTISNKHSDVKLTANNRLGLRILPSTSAEVPLLYHRLAVCSRLASQHRIWLLPGGYPGPGHHYLERPKLFPRSMARNTHDHRRSSDCDSLQYFLREEASIDRRRDTDHSRLWLFRDLGKIQPRVICKNLS